MITSLGASVLLKGFTDKEVDHLASVEGHLDYMSLPLAVQQQHYQHLCTHPVVEQHKLVGLMIQRHVGKKLPGMMLQGMMLQGMMLQGMMLLGMMLLGKHPGMRFGH